MAEPLSSLPVSPPAKPIPWPDQTQNAGLPPVPPVKTSTVPRQPLNDAVELALHRIQRSWADLERGITHLVSRTRKKMMHFGRERPLGIVAAVALTGFLLGVTLRIWRGRDD